MTTPDLSLIIACYDQAAWMELVLPSVLAQDFNVSFEILICDDGSTGDVLEVISRIARGRSTDVRYIWQPDRGFRASRSRNNAIRCARGRLLVFVDGDTWLAPSFLLDHWRAHGETASFVCGKRNALMVEDRAEIARLRPYELSQILQQSQPESREQQAWFESDVPWMACLGGNFSVPRVPDLQFDESFQSWGSEDRDFAFRLFRSGMTPHLLPRANAVHIRLPGDLLKAMDHESVVELFENKILLRSKYPNGEMRPSLELLRYCHFDAGLRQWFIGPSRPEPVDVIIYEFERWKAGRACRAAAI